MNTNKRSEALRKLPRPPKVMGLFSDTKQLLKRLNEGHKSAFKKPFQLQ